MRLPGPETGTRDQDLTLISQMTPIAQKRSTGTSESAIDCEKEWTLDRCPLVHSRDELRNRYRLHEHCPTPLGLAPRVHFLGVPAR